MDNVIKLEKLHVHSVYDAIGGHFSETRHSPWPQVAVYLNSLPDGSLVADIGCGNGKYDRVNQAITLIGCDTSSTLLEVCATKRMEVLLADQISLPYRNGVFDGAICIAVIHHLASDERRLAALKQIVRTLRVGGTALVYVWAFEQRDKKGKTSNYVKQTRENNKDVLKSDEITNSSKINSTEFNLPVHCNRTKFEAQDVLVPWKTKTTNDKQQISDKCDTKLRFYHVFKEGELEELLSNITNVDIIKSYYDQGNWCVIFSKTN